METDLLHTVGQIAGIGGLALGVLLLVFRQIIARNIFPTLKKDDAYRLLRLISVLVFVVALAGIGAWVWTETVAGDAGGSPVNVRAEDGSVGIGGSVDGSTITIGGQDPDAEAVGPDDAP